MSLKQTNERQDSYLADLFNKAKNIIPSSPKKPLLNRNQKIGVVILGIALASFIAGKIIFGEANKTVQNPRRYILAQSSSSNRTYPKKLRTSYRSMVVNMQTRFLLIMPKKPTKTRTMEKV